MKKLALLIFILVFAPAFTYPVFADEIYTPIRVNADIYVDGNRILSEIELLAVNGRMLVPARTVFSSTGARVNWYPKTQRVNIIKDDIIINMEIGSRNAKVNGEWKVMDATPLLEKEIVMVPVRFVSEQLNQKINWNGESSAVYIGEYDTSNKNEDSIIDISKILGRTPIVVIDPGHGGKLPGAVYAGVQEKDLNLDIALRLNELLKKHGVKTYMTRYDDSDVGLYSRAYFANSLGAELFISIHNNAGNSRTSGSMTLYYPANGGFTGKNFASIVQQELVKTLGTKNLGIYPRPNLVVLRKTNMLAIVAEVAYMTNSFDMSRLKTQDFRQQAAEALKNGIIKALKAK